MDDDENSLKDNPDGIPEENVDVNNNKENDFEFAKPSMPIYRSSSNAGRQRPISAPAELMVKTSVNKFHNICQWLSGDV